MTNLVTETGGPWYITATLNTSLAESNAALLGNTTVPVVDGWANYTDLALTRSGDPFYLTFTVSQPAGIFAELVEELGMELDVNPSVDRDIEPVTAGLRTWANAVKGHPFVLSVVLQDGVTGEIITDIDWKVLPSSKHKTFV